MRYIKTLGFGVAILVAVGCSAPTTPTAPISPAAVKVAHDWICPLGSGFVIRTGYEPGCEPYGGQ